MRGVFATVVAAIICTAATASAEPTDEQRALAATLFDEGKALMTTGKVAAGCRKLEESERLAPLPGTLLNLAVCHELEGKLASAMAEFRQARSLAQRDHRDDRVVLAEQHLAAIAPRVSKLVIVVGSDADVPGLSIDVDGTNIGRAAWGSAMPIDPGERRVTISAPGRLERRVVVVVKPDGDVERVPIAPLADAPKPLAPLSSVALTRDSVPAPNFRWSQRRIAGLLLGGAGVIALGFGVGFGAHALAEHGDSANACTRVPCEARSIMANDDVWRSANLATATFVVGIVALAAGSLLWLLGR